MHHATTQIIQLLNNPELDFGSNPVDAEMLEDPGMLRSAVEALLDSPRFPGGREAAERMRPCVGEADWPLIAREFSNRLQATSQFFQAP